MQTITVNHPELIQKIITRCNVTPALPHNSISTEHLNAQADALWDTGATRSVITPDLVKKLKLKPTENRIIQTANGNVNTKLYNVNIELDNGVLFNNLTVAAIQLPTTQVIIGMDVITKGDMAITNGNQKTTFSFQIPPTRTIDFKIDEEKVNNARQRKELLIISNATMRKKHNKNIVQGKKTLDICNG